MISPFSEAGVINAAACRLLIDTYNAIAPYAICRDQHGNSLVQWSELIMSRQAATTLLEATRRCLCLTADAFGLKTIYPETVLLAMIQDGQAHEPHADNEKRVNNEWVPNHTPQRDYAGLLYLNSDFEGGELHFEGDGSRIFRPSGGLYVSFPCDRRFVHQVTPVEHGRRYSLALWFTCRHSYANLALVDALDQLPERRDHS